MGTASQPLGRFDVPVVDLLPMGVVVADDEGSAMYANRTWTTMTGLSAVESLGAGWLSVLDDVEKEAQRHALATAARRGVSYVSDWRPRAGAAASRVFHAVGTPDVDDDPPRRIVVTFLEVTEERARVERLFHRATHDPVTGLYNRQQYMELLHRALERRSHRPGSVDAVLFIDVDRLKLTNDRFGHDAGDKVLRTVAECISVSVRPEDVTARYGGDEFTVYCQDLPGPGAARAITQRIRRAIRAANLESGPVSLSIGVAIVDDRAPDPAGTVARADRAMYRNKRLRRSASGWCGDELGGDRAHREPVEVLAAAAHALRTPLATIASLAATLRQRAGQLSPTEFDEALAAFERQVARLTVLVGDLLDLGVWRRGGATRHGPAGLSAAVADALELSPPPPEVSVSIAGQPVEMQVAIDPSALRRVIVNLLTNAYRYGGSRIVIGWERRASAAELYVEDDGPGVVSSRRKTMFLPFNGGGIRRQAGPGSTGLGLALCQDIVGDSGGHISCQPARPHGTRMVVTLPTA